MSIVGPRPNVEQEVATYTVEEGKLLSVQPGITDLASIVFSDEGNILEGCDDPDLKYSQVIRPWKSRLGILNVENRSFLLDIKIMFLTVLAVVNKQRALGAVHKILRDLGANEQLTKVALRDAEPPAFPPPGADKIIQQQG